MAPAQHEASSIPTRPVTWLTALSRPAVTHTQTTRPRPACHSQARGSAAETSYHFPKPEWLVFLIAQIELLRIYSCTSGCLFKMVMRSYKERMEVNETLAKFHGKEFCLQLPQHWDYQSISTALFFFTRFHFGYDTILIPWVGIRVP